MIYLDTSDTMLLREDRSTTPWTLECIDQADAERYPHSEWQPWEGTQDEFDAAIGCQAPLHYIPWHLRDDGDESPLGDRMCPGPGPQCLCAQLVAESLQAHGLDIQAPATWERYGVRPESDLGRLILRAYSEFGKKKSPDP